jgi:hypothetical protein
VDPEEIYQPTNQPLGNAHFNKVQKNYRPPALPLRAPADQLFFRQPCVLR